MDMKKEIKGFAYANKLNKALPFLFNPLYMFKYINVSNI